jgi:chitinase
LLVVFGIVSQISGTTFALERRPWSQGQDVQMPIIVSAAYPSWRASTFPPENLPFADVDQIGHCFVRPGEHGALEVPNGFVMPQLIEQAHRTHRQVILGVGGASSYSAFSSMVAEPNERALFVQNLTDFSLTHGYDGLNIDWEFPRTVADRENLNALMAELRSALDATGRDLYLSIAVSSNERMGEWIDVGAITPLVDHYLVMTFGYYGAWGSESGHNAPLYPSPTPEGHSRSVDQSLRYWSETRGVPRSKILMGLASFGIWFDSEALYQPFLASTKADYRDIRPLIGQGYTRHWDGSASVPYLLHDDGPGVWSYDDPQSVGAKYDYLLANGLGGFAVWDVTMDLVAGEHELLKVIAQRRMPRQVYLPLVRSDGMGSRELAAAGG